MTEETLSEIKKVNEKHPNRLLLCVIKGRYPFITDLPDLDLSNVTSVLFLNSALRATVPETTLNVFDHVIWFDAGEFWSGNNLANLDTLDFPDLRTTITDLCRVVGSEKIRLVAMEEQFVRFVAEMRTLCNIIGPKPKDIEPYTDKIKIKYVASKKGIPTAKFKIVQNSELEDEIKLKLLEDSISYPMFIKPVHGVGGAGTLKVNNRSEIYQWLKVTSTDNDGEKMYLIEEYITGHEINLLGFCQNGTTEFFPAILSVLPPITIFSFLQTGRPMPVCTVREEQTTKLFEFAHLVAKAFKPIDGSLFFVQVFDTAKGLILNELACRPPGAVGSAIFYHNSGISPETVHIMGQVKTVQLNHFLKQTPFYGMIVYPKRLIHSCKLNPVPMDQLLSFVKTQWLVEEGQQLNAASNVGDVVARISLWNDDYNNLLKDLVYLSNNYDPLA